MLLFYINLIAFEKYLLMGLGDDFHCPHTHSAKLIIIFVIKKLTFRGNRNVSWFMGFMRFIRLINGESD